MKTAKKLFGLLLVVATLLLAACSQAPTPGDDALESQSGGLTCSTAAPLVRGSAGGTINSMVGNDWYSGSNLMIPGGTPGTLTFRNMSSSSTLRVDVFASCPGIGGMLVRSYLVARGSPSIVIDAITSTGNFYLRVSGTAGTPYNLSYSAPVAPDTCLFDGSCTFLEIPVIIDDCWVCNNINLDILRDILESYRIRLTIPDLGIDPVKFSQAISFKVLTSQGKLIAQGKGNGQEAMLELVAKLPKGSYKLQVNILDQSIAKIIHANNQKYPLKFGFSLVK